MINNELKQILKKIKQQVYAKFIDKWIVGIFLLLACSTKIGKIKSEELYCMWRVKESRRATLVWWIQQCCCSYGYLHHILGTIFQQVLRYSLLLFQIILGHENSEPRVTQLPVQFTQVLSAFQTYEMSR